MKPRLLDLFCGAGGATKGYQRAGFHVTGVDIAPQKNYCGDEFVQADALNYLRGWNVPEGDFEGWWVPFDAIHASPPCQAYSMLRSVHQDREYPDLIEPTRDLLKETGLPYVIENVQTAASKMIDPVILCGSSFGLGSNGRYLRRHRCFETNFPILTPPCDHSGRYAIGVYGHGKWDNNTSDKSVGRRGGYQGTKHEKSEAMGIDWMIQTELSQAIPPAYTELIGAQLLAQIMVEA